MEKHVRFIELRGTATFQTNWVGTLVINTFNLADAKPYQFARQKAVYNPRCPRCRWPRWARSASSTFGSIWAHCSGIFFNDNASVVLPLVFNGILVLPPASAFENAPSAVAIFLSQHRSASAFVGAHGVTRGNSAEPGKDVTRTSLIDYRLVHCRTGRCGDPTRVKDLWRVSNVPKQWCDGLVDTACDGCLRGRATHLPPMGHLPNYSNTCRPGGLVCFDVWETTSPCMIGGEIKRVLFVEMRSAFCRGYRLKSESQVPEAAKLFEPYLSANSNGKIRVGCYCTDGGKAESHSRIMHDHCNERHIQLKTANRKSRPEPPPSATTAPSRRWRARPRAMATSTDEVADRLMQFAMDDAENAHSMCCRARGTTPSPPAHTAPSAPSPSRSPATHRRPSLCANYVVLDGVDSPKGHEGWARAVRGLNLGPCREQSRPDADAARAADALPGQVQCDLLRPQLLVRARVPRPGAHRARGVHRAQAGLQAGHARHARHAQQGRGDPVRRRHQVAHGRAACARRRRRGAPRRRGQRRRGVRRHGRGRRRVPRRQRP